MSRVSLVVAAAILDDLERPTRLLAARRSSPKTLAGMWEFPGGKVEPGELPADGLQRELVEELGVAVTLGSIVAGPGADDVESGGVLSDVAGLGGEGNDAARFVWPIHNGHWMLVWTAVLAGGDPRPLQDHDELRWLEVGQWHTVPWLPADLPIVDAVARQVGVEPG
ncbi:(deoxy)nucleoside triphosphate pyrophosphohydrolase [Salana multivorans]